MARRGFTLIEMLVAIVLAALVAATARAVVETIGDAATRLAVTAVTEDAARGGDILSRTIIRQARSLRGDSISFFGTGRGFVIQSWCPVPGGWSEVCQAAFAVDDSATSVILRAGSTPLVAFRGRESVALRYLATAENGGRWVDRWASNGLPAAVGIIVDGDTLIVPVGR